MILISLIQLGGLCNHVIVLILEFCIQLSKTIVLARWGKLLRKQHRKNNYVLFASLHLQIQSYFWWFSLFVCAPKKIAHTHTHSVWRLKIGQVLQTLHLCIRSFCSLIITTLNIHTAHYNRILMHVKLHWQAFFQEFQLYRTKKKKKRTHFFS